MTLRLSRPRILAVLLAHVCAVAAPAVHAQTTPTSPAPAKQNLIYTTTTVRPPTPAVARTAAVADFSTCAKPEWPKAALREEDEGIVTLHFLIDVDGAVVESKIARTSMYPLLDSAAQYSIMLCKFKSGTRDGKPVKSWMQMQYVWTLGEDLDESPKARLEAEEGALRGDTISEYKLAKLCRYAKQMPLDLLEAQRLFALAASKNHIPSMLELASLLRNSPEGKVKRKFILDLYAKAASLGDASAQYFQAMMLLEVPAEPGNRDEAEALLRSATAKKYTSAVTPLGALLLNSPQKAGDQAEGIQFLRWSVARNEPYATVVLGRAYENGTGVGQDYAAAAALYQKTADARFLEARFALARLYAEGLGVPRDAEKAAALRTSIKKVE